MAMRPLKFLFLAILLLPGFISCGRLLGQRDSLRTGSTTVTVRLKDRSGLNITNTLQGGVMIYAVNTNVTRGGATGLTNEFDQTVFTLFNDTYKFFAVGWTGGSGPYYPLEGQGYCGYGNGGNPVELNGQPTNVTLILSQASCGFASGSYFTDILGSDGTGTNFDLVTVNACSGFASTACSPPNTSFAGSVQVSMDAWVHEDGVTTIENVSLLSRCFTFTSGVATTSLRLPTGLSDPGGTSTPNPFQITANIYSSANCTGPSYQAHQFDGGIFNGNRSGLTSVSLSGTPNMLNLLVP